MAEYIKVPAGVYDMVTRCMEQEFPDHVAIRYVAEDGKTVVEKKYREYAQDIRRMIELAHAAGFAVMAHANGDRAVTAALQAGVDSIEHGAYLSESVLLRMAQQRTLWVPTLSTIGNLIGSGRYPDAVLKRLLAQQQEAVRFVAAHGGRIGLGSDAGAWHDARAGHFGRARVSHCSARPAHGAASAGGRSACFCYILSKVTVDLPKFLRYNNEKCQKERERYAICAF